MSGIISRFAPLVLGGVIFFAGSVVAVFFQKQYQSLVNAAVIFLGYLVPGYILRYSKNGKDV